MRILNTFLLSVCKSAMTLIIPAMTLIVFVQVILRYGFSSSLSWVEEVARLLLVWTTCLGAVYATRQGMHTSIEFFTAKAKGRLKLGIIVVSNLSALSFFAVAVWYGVQYARMGVIQSSGALGIPMVYMYSAIPVAFTLMLFIGIERFADVLKQVLSSGESEDAT